MNWKDIKIVLPTEIPDWYLSTHWIKLERP